MGDKRLELPPHLGVRPESRYKWEFPTAWLLGTQIATSLREMGLSAISSFDARDWMTANKIKLTSKTVGEAEEEACWIDFLADTGDSPRLVYQLAYLLQQPALEVLCRVGKTKDAWLADDSGAKLALPRGAALVIGGDTAYPIATRRRLIERVRAPFIWARNELGAKAAPLDPPVRLLGIPGNHDYYNELVGFERQFHANGPLAPLHERVELPGYEVEQHASYFAAQLAFGWQLWALDIERKGIDHRQLAYFNGVDNGTNNRIVVTSKPAFVYGGRSHEDREGEHSIGHSFGQLKLDLAYRHHGKLPADQLRLDLSGDTHIYERYWGHTVEPRTTETHEREPQRNYRPPDIQPEVRPTPNYASVVSGLGGAFHHPSQIRQGQTPPHCSWPSVMDSACEIMNRLIRPRKVFQAGAVGIVGLFVGALCFAAVWVSDPRHNVLDVPFALPGCSDDMLVSLLHLAITGSIIGTIVGVIGVLYGSWKLGQRLGRPLELMEKPRGLTYRLSHHPFTHWLLRWGGGSRRNLWGFLKTSPAWLLAGGAVTGVILALANCRHLALAADGFGPIYTVTVLLTLGVGALGFFVAGKGRSIARRIPFAIFGLLAGLAFVWTPYAWTRLMLCADDNRWLAVMFFAYFPLRLVLKRIFATRAVTTTPALRATLALVGYLAILALFSVIPILGITLPDKPTAMPGVGVFVNMLFGAYFACLWIGWYFYVCLQFGGHGNEAGSASRVVSFAQFVRIRLMNNRADVWVIAAEDQKPRRPWWRPWDRASLSEMTPNARLVDHFTISR